MPLPLMLPVPSGIYCSKNANPSKEFDKFCEDEGREEKQNSNGDGQINAIRERPAKDKATMSPCS